MDIDKVSYLDKVDNLEDVLFIVFTSLVQDNTAKVDASTNSTKNIVSKYLTNLHANHLRKHLDVIQNNLVLNKYRIVPNTAQPPLYYMLNAITEDLNSVLYSKTHTHMIVCLHQSLGI